MPRPSLPAVILLLMALSAAVSPWRRELFVGDETKYSQVVREMRATGHWFLPTLEGAPFTHKPPVHFWFVGLFSLLFGLYSIWPFVLPSLLAFFFLLWLMTRISRELIPEVDSRWAAFVCGTSIMVWGSAQTARMDVSFTALVALGCWMMYRFFERDDFRSLLWAALALAAATLIKGPMAPVIGVALFIFECIRRKRVPRGNYLPALAALILIPLLWFGAAMQVGGDAYTQEVLQKQIARRAVGAWVHRAAPWFYFVRAPLTLFPWFLLLVLSIFRKNLGSGARFARSWVLAVIVPYTLISSKLDVYMMVMIPAVALLVADAIAVGKVWANRAMLILLALIGIAGLFVNEPAEYAIPIVKGLFVVMALAAIIGLALTWRSFARSTIAVGLVPLAALLYVATALIPLANEEASTRPLVRALASLNVPPEQISLHACPHLWIRGMPRHLERVRYGFDRNAPVVVTARKKASEIDLSGYRKTGELRMIGKWFDIWVADRGSQVAGAR